MNTPNSTKAKLSVTSTGHSIIAALRELVKALHAKRTELFEGVTQ